MIRHNDLTRAIAVGMQLQRSADAINAGMQGQVLEHRESIQFQRLDAQAEREPERISDLNVNLNACG